MKKEIYLIFFIFLFVTVACSKSASVENSQVKNNTPQNVPTVKPTLTKEVKPLIDFFKIANKSPNEIEKIYGKHILVDTKIVQSKDGEFRHYKVFKESESKLEHLQVDYYKGKSVGLYLNIPQKFQTKDVEETIKLCGLKLNASDAQIGGTGEDYWWENSQESSPFYSVHIRKYKDSGLFHTCEAHIKI
jgi:hypothetical protein